MELTGEKVIAAPRQRVYDALHDTAILRQAIPGCQALTKVGENRYEATVALESGPLKGSFFGTIHVYSADPPSGFSLRASASGGLAGNAAGDADVALASIDVTTTNLAYHLTADVNGQLAGLDGRQLDSAARTLVAEFFSRLETVLDTSRFVATSAPTTDATGAPMGGWDPRRVSAANDVSDETAYSTSQYTRVGSRAVATEIAPHQFESAAAPRLTTAPATTDALGEPLRPAADPADDEPYDDPPYAPMPASTRLGRVDPLPVPPSFGQHPRSAATPEPAGSGMTIWRWFQVLVGLVAIAALLTGAI